MCNFCDLSCWISLSSYRFSLLCPLLLLLRCGALPCATQAAAFAQFLCRGVEGAVGGRLFLGSLQRLFFTVHGFNQIGCLEECKWDARGVSWENAPGAS